MPRKVVTGTEGLEAMLFRGALPVAPWPGTQAPWKCLCLTCFQVSEPRYNDVVNKGTGVCNQICRSRKIAGKLRKDEAKAAAVMRQWGWKVLEPYRGAGKSWKSACIECGTVKSKRLSHVQEGRGNCTACSGRDITDECANKLLEQNDLRPLVDYPGGSLDPWLSECLRCHHVGSPTYAKVRVRGHQCWNCRSEKIADALRLSAAEAIASMVERGLEPLAPYPGGTDISWMSRCEICETKLDPGPTLHNIRSGQGGCPACAERGVNPMKPGYLYLVTHSGHNALKWGIANIDQRIRQHVSQGWTVAARWDFALAQEAWAFERQVKRWIRGQGVGIALEAGQMKYRGHTETASLDDITIDEMRHFVESLVGRSPDVLAD